MTHKPMIWSIGGSDPSACAGIQADLLTGQDFAVHVSTVITAVTAQNSDGIYQIEASDKALLRAQLRALQAIGPVPVIKIGMLASSRQVKALASRLARYRVQWPKPPFVILDPVLRASSGDSLANDKILTAIPALLSQVDLITPNADELELLTGVRPDSPEMIRKACDRLISGGVGAVLAKGGHFDFQPNLAVDFYTDGEREILLSSKRLQQDNQRGTGCTLATALASAIAQDYFIEDALVLAKAYVQQGLDQAHTLGSMKGPVAHAGWPEERRYFPRIESAQTELGQWFGLTECWPEKLPVSSCETRHLGLYPVVDSLEWVERLLKLGVKTLQLRIKDQPEQTVEDDIKRAIELGHQHKARLFINDYWQLAIKHGAYGVHLGQEDLEVADLARIAKARLRLGISTHGYFELMRAHQLGPSYIALGHIFPTTTKVMASNPQGLTRLKRYADLMDDYPLVAIGGIDIPRARQVSALGLGSIAVVRAITEAEDPVLAVEILQGICAEKEIA